MVYGCHGCDFKPVRIRRIQSRIHAHWVALDRELESVAGTIHDSIELKLKQPGRIEPVVQQQSSSKRHILSAIHQGYYYVRFFDNSGRLIAIVLVKVAVIG